MKRRSVPLVFLSGEGLKARIWDESLRFFQKKGFDVTAFEYDECSRCASIDAQLSFLKDAFHVQNPSPPVLVAHSLSTYVAQKYLEHGSLVGLILVNPLPINPSAACIALFNRWVASLESSRGSYIDEACIRSALWRYYQGIDSSPNSNIDELQKHSIRTPVPSKIFMDRVTDIFPHNSARHDQRLTFPIPLQTMHEVFLKSAAAPLSLDPGTVPVMLIYSDGDDGIVTEDEREQLRLLHRVPSLYQLHFTSPDESLGRPWGADNQSKLSNETERSAQFREHGVYNDLDLREQAPIECIGNRLPMITHQNQFNESILYWLQAVT